LVTQNWSIRVVDASTFGPFLKTVANGLGFESEDALPDGVGELHAGEFRLSYAVNRSIAFAAFRWLDAGPSVQEVETFYLGNLTRAPHAGLRTRSLADRGQSAPGFESDWESAVGGYPTTLPGPAPGFLELAGLLASSGTATLTNADLLSQARALESELSYAKLTIHDLESALSVAEENLRFMSTAGTQRVREVAKPKAPPPLELGTGKLPEVPGWALEHADRVVILPRALAGAKKSQYETPEAVMAALAFLAGPYRAHKRGELSLAEFTDALKEQPFQLANSVGASVAGEQGEQYYVRWAGRRVFMDQHLLKGGGREPRYCMRIYFFWDPVTERAVVGSMTHHLENRLS
jgi:hypothetical protein